MSKYKITAENQTEFKLILEELKKLPSPVLAQIEYAEKKFSYIHCSLFEDFNKTALVHLPKDQIDTVQIEKECVVAFDETFRYEKIIKESQSVKINFI